MASIAAPENGNHAVKTAVIGAGDWGKNHIRKFHELGSLIAISETNEERAATFTAEYGVANLSFEDILEDDGIDAVVLASPATTHKELGLRAMEKGKHLFVEKPLALTEEDAAALTAKAAETGKILMVGHLLQYHPGFIGMRELVKSGELGKLRHIHARRYNIGKFRQEENVIWDLGPHDASMVLALTGTEPTSIRTEVSNYLLPTISDFATIHLTFPGNINAELSLSWLAPQKEHRLIVIGDKAMAVFDDTLEWDEKLRIHRHQTGMEYGKPPLLERDMEGEAIPMPFKEPLLNECATFLSSIAENSQPFSNGEEALKVIRLLTKADPALATETEGTATPAISRAS
ncbi:MAG: oxidoreductase [Rhodomicrobium sp.]|nr:MAG: oxidoreductase [Rhodomicrobium sp.]